MDELKQIEALKDDEIEIDLVEIFHVLLHRLWLILLCFAVGAVMAFGLTQFAMTPQYSATSMIFILTKTTSVTSLADIQMSSQLTADFEVLAKSRPVVENVIENLKLDTKYEDLVDKLTVENSADTRILKFTVEDPDPAVAKELANAFADATADQVANVMDTDKPNVVERAVEPANPSSPSKVKNTMIGALLGAFLAVGVILLQYFLNDTIQTEEDIRKYLNLHTLAAVPLEKRK